MKSKNKTLQRHGLLLLVLYVTAFSAVASTSASFEDTSNSSEDTSPLIVKTELLTDESFFGDVDNNNTEQQQYQQQLKDENQSPSDEIISDEFDDMLNLHYDNDLSQQQEDHEWDVLIFTQQWPVTTCYHWREEDHTHPCTLPTKKEFWTIHGIWPTKLGHFGPSFCNKSADFNLDQLQSIVDRMKQFWPDLDGESQSHDWLWKHEWLKHGTCAALINELNNELKYFEHGLNWRDDYSISRILSDSNIHPDSNNTVIALQNALLKGLNKKNPSIHCIYDNKHDISYLAEIRICFNKTLDLTDCNGVKIGDAVLIDYPGGTVITNCHISKPVHYPSMVPPLLRLRNNKNWKFPIVNMYKLLQFIMWVTL